MASRVRESNGHTRSMKACTTCRQAKLRCDATSMFPGPCSRCKNNERVCVFNPAFKRTPTRSKLERVTEELADLRRQILGGTAQSGLRGNSRTQSSHSRPATLEDANEPMSNYHYQSAPQRATDSGSEDIFGFRAAFANPEFGQSARLGNIEITFQEILDLFGFFIKNQYHYLPILDTRTPISSIQTHTPFLFWTIIMTSCRFQRSYCHLLPLIKESYQELLGKALATSPMSLRTIQALLLHCYWPLPCRKQPQDPSWNICGMVTNAASYHGLNAPRDQRWSKLTNEERNIRSKIWLACVYIGTSLAVHYGSSLPMRSSSDINTIAHMLEKFDPGASFAVQVEIQRQVSRYMSVFTTDQNCPFNMAAMKIFETELDNMSSKFRRAWNIYTECSLLRAKLNLYALTCIQIQESRHTGYSYLPYSEEQDSLQVIQLSGLRTAIKLIHTFSEIVNERVAATNFSNSNSGESVRPSICIPKLFTLANTFATIFLLKFCAFNSRFSQNDRDLAQNYIKLTHDTYAKLSIHPLDEAGRTAEVIEVLSKREDSEIRIKDRQGASIYYDALQKAAEWRGRQVDVPIPEISLGDESQESNTGSIGGDGNGLDLNSHLFQLDSLDLWPSYLQLSNERWAFDNVQSFDDARNSQFIDEDFNNFTWS